MSAPKIIKVNATRSTNDRVKMLIKSKKILSGDLIIAKYQYQIAFVADQEINLLACLTEIMVECEFK